MSKELEKLYTYNNELVAQRHKLIAEVKRLKKYDDTAEFNKGWKAAQAGEPLGDMQDGEAQGWIVFMFDGQQAELNKAYKERGELLDLIGEWGGIDGDHHKKWLLDKIVKLVVVDYEAWVKDYNDGEDGPNTYEWDVGIAP